MTKTSRRRFTQTLAALAGASAPAAAQKKQQADQSEGQAEEPPCVVNSGLAAYDIPRSTEPSFVFKP